MFLRKYGAAAVIDGIPLITRGSMDYKSSPTLAAGDVTISKDGGAFANIEGAGVFGDFVAVAPAAGTSVQIKPDAAALTCKRLCIRLIDQTVPKEWEDQEVIIETYGHASAQIIGNMDDAATESTLTRALGLVMENHVEDDIVRDSNGMKTSSVIYLYDTAANATAHDKATGIVAKYDVSVTYSARKLVRLKVIKE